MLKVQRDYYLLPPTAPLPAINGVAVSDEAAAQHCRSNEENTGTGTERKECSATIKVRIQRQSG
ncbi:hypothetical protein [Loktanella sp. M215]|uniref:hypothetical protein n=1 Tax=Loktanella sp. M215 TaxID=2675431 RepID=UPI001F277312|nr:hypothetical protein [Loktanella sp. M215]MCF7701891.1 hypothetical protein [Loktanella sp. M215]